MVVNIVHDIFGKEILKNYSELLDLFEHIVATQKSSTISTILHSSRGRKCDRDLGSCSHPTTRHAICDTYLFLMGELSFGPLGLHRRVHLVKRLEKPTRKLETCWKFLDHHMCSSMHLTVLPSSLLAARCQTLRFPA